MARFFAFSLLALASSASAFMAPLASSFCRSSVAPSRSTATSPVVRMMAAEAVAPPTADSLREMAQACQDDGCSVEAVGQLLDQLKAKKKELEMQLVTVDDVLAMMGDTSKLGEKSELEKLVMAVGRVFTLNDDDYPYLSYPTGYSGDVNKEKRDAWDYNVNTPLKPKKPYYGKETS